MSTTYTVLIRRFDGTEPDHVIGTGMSERKSDQVEMGALMNLNTDDYCVVVEEDKDDA